MCSKTSRKGVLKRLERGIHTSKSVSKISLRRKYQGQRVKAYAVKETDGEGCNHAGLMDTMFKLELEWAICDCTKLSAYVGYSDFLFDRKIRHGARNYEWSGRWDESWNIVGGLALTIGF